MKNTGVILLAAGNSTRMGSPKQLLIYEGKTLLDRMIETASMAFDNEQITLVLGANHDEILSATDDLSFKLGLNLIILTTSSLKGIFSV
ncbi:MAG: hypothetical protein EOO19_13055 [Chryseobacterium sp.]|nr:MAG: hypothetical protein EOO19_13055 [Chryseobacterium sp.]